jgi:hypothetical protein
VAFTGHKIVTETICSVVLPTKHEHFQNEVSVQAVNVAPILDSVVIVCSDDVGPFQQPPSS